MHFFVLGQTKIVTPPQDINIKRGSMVELMCKVEYDLSFTDELKILWQKDKEEIDFSSIEDSRWAAQQIVQPNLYLYG